MKCSKEVWSGYHAYPCKNAGKVERGGKPFCNIHDPEKVAATLAATAAKWRAEDEANAKRRQLEHAAPDLADALDYFLTMFGETPDGEWALQIMEDGSTMSGSLDRARAALSKAGRLP